MVMVCEKFGYTPEQQRIIARLEHIIGELYYHQDLSDFNRMLPILENFWDNQPVMAIYELEHCGLTEEVMRPIRAAFNVRRLS